MEVIDAHRARIEQLRESFSLAAGRLTARLRDATDSSAETAQPGAWSAAQIGWHVAAVTTRFAGVISGEVPAAQAMPAEFTERAWTEILASIPARIAAPPATEPPPDVRRGEAVAALEASAARMTRALEALTAERGSRMGITHPLVGTITVYQVGDWATAHIRRHNDQARRALGQVIRTPGGGPSGAA